jgi:hypothetical protein
MLFPLGAMRSVSRRWQILIDDVFAGEWRHIALHLFIFAGLVFLLFALFHLPWNRTGWLTAALTILVVGTLQELLQALTGASSATWSGAFFDLGIDLIGGGLGGLFWAVLKTTKRM